MEDYLIFQCFLLFSFVLDYIMFSYWAWAKLTMPTTSTQLPFVVRKFSQRKTNNLSHIHDKDGQIFLLWMWTKEKVKWKWGTTVTDSTLVLAVSIKDNWESLNVSMLLPSPGQKVKDGTDVWVTTGSSFCAIFSPLFYKPLKKCCLLPSSTCNPLSPSPTFLSLPLELKASEITDIISGA